MNTFIALNLDKEDIIFQELIFGNNRVVNIIENNNVEESKNSTYNCVEVIEVNSDNFYTVAEELCINTMNSIIVTLQHENIDKIINLKKYASIMYYCNSNFYLDSDNIFQSNIIINHIKFCETAQFIAVNDIELYFFINKIEGINNVMLVKNSKTDNEKYYKDIMLLLSQEEKSTLSTNLALYLFENYKSFSTFIIYGYYLLINNNIEDLAKIIFQNDYIKEIYKVELAYLLKENKYDLFKYMFNLSIKNYVYCLNNIDENNKYKLANLYFDISYYNDAYKLYMSLIDEKSELMSSIILNRNIAYIMYLVDNYEYVAYYNIYLESLNQFI